MDCRPDLDCPGKRLRLTAVLWECAAVGRSRCSASPSLRPGSVPAPAPSPVDRPTDPPPGRPLMRPRSKRPLTAHLWRSSVPPDSRHHTGNVTVSHVTATNSHVTNASHFVTVTSQSRHIHTTHVTVTYAIVISHVTAMPQSRHNHRRVTLTLQSDVTSSLRYSHIGHVTFMLHWHQSYFV